MNTSENLSSQIVQGGFLAAFEGIDGSGKTTIARRVTAKLRSNGYLAEYLREPTDGPFGRQLREILVSTAVRNPHREFELFVLDRQDDVKTNIRPILDKGGVICIDRYYISSMAYQGAMGLDPELIRNANEAFAPIPDMIFRFCVPIDMALERIRGSRPEGANEFEKRDYLEQVESQFTKMNFSQMVDIDASESSETVFGKVWTLISAELERVSQQK